MKKSPGSEGEETFDTLFDGRLKIRQRREGYRFSIDALLLSHFAEPRPKDRVIDLGTGCGVIPLVLVFRRKAEAVIGVEIQPSLAALARQNVSLNGVSSKIEIWEKNFKELVRERDRGTFDLVISNPPYRKVGSGRVNPLEEKALARHEILATLEDVLRTAHHLLKNRGRYYSIYPASRTADLFQRMRQFYLEPKRVQFVHSKSQDDARLVLVEALKEGRTQIKVLPPFVLYDSRNQYTAQARALFI